MVDSSKMHFCVIGDPIAHSRSPEIHQFVFHEMGLSHEYTKQHITEEALASFVDDVRVKKYLSGFNVTVPHKRQIMPLLDKIEPFAENVGAVNTVHILDDVFIGYNTDVLGCRAALEKAGCQYPERVAQIGCGGAARASVQAILSMGAKEVILYDLDEKRVMEIMRAFQKKSNATLTAGHLNEASMKVDMKECDLIINATPVGMWPDVDQSPVTAEAIPEGIIVLDMVYNPVETLFIKQAKSRGCRAASGLMMLVAQALAADQIWLGRQLPDSLPDRVFQFMIKADK